MWTVIWYSIVLAVAGTLLLRLAGRKSISQMTSPQLAIMLSIGTILGSEVANKGLVNSIIAVATFIAVLVAVEWITLKWNAAEATLKGKATPIISNGRLMEHNLKKLRLSVDDLEKRLRMDGISRIEDVQSGTIEHNGELGYELMPHARPVTMGDLEKLIKANFPQITIPEQTGKEDIFMEVMNGSHHQDNPKSLQ